MIRKNLRWMAAVLLATNLAAVTPGPVFAGGNGKGNGGGTTTTPIKHVVVIFQENISFDHYFATYPKATNPSEEVQFHAKSSTPSVNGLIQALQEHNNNQDKNAVLYQPVRLDPSQNYTCDQTNHYTNEQEAFDSGLMDKFPQFTGVGSTTAAPCNDLGEWALRCFVMGYYDGNVVTGIWNYAQNFAMSDNWFGTKFGPSTVGALNLAAGQTWGARSHRISTGIPGARRRETETWRVPRGVPACTRTSATRGPPRRSTTARCLRIRPRHAPGPTSR